MQAIIMRWGGRGGGGGEGSDSDVEAGLAHSEGQIAEVRARRERDLAALDKLEQECALALSLSLLSSLFLFLPHSPS